MLSPDCQSRDGIPTAEELKAGNNSALTAEWFSCCYFFLTAQKITKISTKFALKKIKVFSYSVAGKYRKSIMEINQ